MLRPKLSSGAPRLPRNQAWMLMIAALAIVLSSIDPLYPANTWLQHGPSLLLVAGAVWLLRRYPMSDGSVACGFALLLLHCLGARYSYSFVPYDDWARSLTGAGLSERFGLARNHYDRVVHLAFGALMVRPAREALMRWGGYAARQAAWAAIAAIMAASLGYEVIEWVIALTLSPATAEAYNGQQGDLFDAQKDMALAVLGAVAVSALMWPRKRR